jgi:tripartite-type tricarboxylate transporter receptor subunit TctC
VQLITPAAAGNGPDVVLRIVAEQLSKMWGEQAVVVNRPGASGQIAASAVIGAVPDGYTLYASNTSSMLILPYVQKLPFDMETSFKPIALYGEQPILVAVSPSLGVNTLGELMALAKSKPGSINFAATTPQSIPRYTMELLLQEAGASMTYVFYSGTAQALSDVVGGRLPVVVDAWSALAGAMANGSLKPLALTSPRRVPQHPNVPAAAETFPNFVVSAWLPLMALTQTPDAIVDKVNKDMAVIAGQPEVQERLLKLNAYTPKPMTPAELRTFLADERKRWVPIVKKVGETSR